VGIHNNNESAGNGSLRMIEKYIINNIPQKMEIFPHFSFHSNGITGGKSKIFHQSYIFYRTKTDDAILEESKIEIEIDGLEFIQSSDKHHVYTETRGCLYMELWISTEA
jgi:hypothetical protein